MNRVKLSLILFLVSGVQMCFAQFVMGTVRDAETNDPLPYVNVWYKGTSVGTFSDELGQFQLPAGDSTKVSFSSVGYERLNYSLKKGESKLQVMLKPDPVRLQTIEVKPDAEWVTKEVGYNRDKKFPYLGITFWDYQKQFWKVVISYEKDESGYINKAHIGILDHIPSEGILIVDLFLTEGKGNEQPLMSGSQQVGIDLSQVGDELVFDLEDLNIPLKKYMNVYLTFIGVEKESLFGGGALEVKYSRGSFKEPRTLHRGSQDEDWHPYPPSDTKFRALNFWLEVDVRKD